MMRNTQDKRPNDEQKINKLLRTVATENINQLINFLSLQRKFTGNLQSTKSLPSSDFSWRSFMMITEEKAK